MKLVERTQPKRLRASVVIPCAHKHSVRLAELLEHLDRQTRKADEIIVALSGCDAPPLPNHVRLLHSAEPCTAGKNRNRASEAATGDVLVYQDADDLPHPQRVEIVLALFERYEIEHLMHGYIYTMGHTWSIGHPGEPSAHRPLPIVMPPLSIEEATEKSSYRSEPLHTTIVTSGEVCVMRSTWEKVRWPERRMTGEDYEFNQAIFKTFKRTVTTNVPLIVYRHHYSAGI
jgi:hypothetical protein